MDPLLQNQLFYFSIIKIELKIHESVLSLDCLEMVIRPEKLVACFRERECAFLNSFRSKGPKLNCTLSKMQNVLICIKQGETGYRNLATHHIQFTYKCR